MKNAETPLVEIPPQPPTLDDFSEWVRLERIRRRLSMREVGQQTDLSASTICRIEQGRAVQMIAALRVARLFGFDLRFVPCADGERRVPA